MKLTTIALAVGLVITGIAAAQEPLTNPVRYQTDIDALNLSSGDLTLEWVDTAFEMQTTTGEVNLTGNGSNSLTLIANKTGTSRSFRFSLVTGSVAFTKFSKLELASAKTDGTGNLILTNGTTSFGTQEQALSSLKFTNLTVGRWAGESNVLDIYSQALEFDTDQVVAVGIAMNIYKVPLAEGQNQLSQFTKVNVGGGSLNAYGGVLSFAEGLLSVNGKDSNGAVVNGVVVLGTKDSPVDAVTIQKDFSVSEGSKVDIVSSDLVSIQKDGGYIQSSGTLTIDANAITIAGGLNNNGQVTLQAEDELRLEKGAGTWVGSLYAPENSTTTIAAEKFFADGTISTQAETTITATNIEISTGSSTAIGVSGEKGSLTFGKTGGDQTLSISSSGSAALISQGTLIVESGNLITNGTLQTNGGTIVIGTEEQPLESVNLSGSRSTATVRSNGGEVSIFAEDVTISNADGYAVSAFTLQREGESDTGNLSIQATNNLTIVGDISVGTDENSSQGYTTQNGNIVIQGGTGTNTIIGDVETYNGNAYTNQDQETALKSANTVSISLSGENSTFIGAVVDNKDEALEALDENHGTTVALSNGAIARLTADSTIAAIKSDSGLVEAQGQLHATTLQAEGNTQVTLNQGAPGANSIDHLTGDGLTIVYTENAVDAFNANDVQGSVMAATDIGEASAGYTVKSKENALIGDTELKVDPQGNVESFSEQVNTVNAGLEDIAGSNFLYFRSTMNDVNKRMGDLRTLPNAAGAWARYYGGKMKYGDRGMDTTYNTLQVGADQRIGNFYVGMSMSISDGDSDLANGSVDHRNYNFGLYGGWLGESGQYVDLIVKRHRLETEGSLRNTSGTGNAFDYNNWGTSVSFEYGWRFTCPNTGFWVEPQAEIMYGKVDATSFTTSQGANVSQDSIDTLVGRFGTAIGYTFAQNRGSAYFKASVLHDWRGETDSTVSVGSGYRTFHDDLGGTWGEFALGGTYNITDKFSAYGDVLTTTGSPIRNPWEVSIGLRYTF